MKVILITGISRGIGRALAQKCLSEGNFVIGTSTLGKTDFEHQNLAVFALNLSKPESITECVLKINELGKEITVFVNNAGVFVEEEGGSLSVETLRKTLEINLIGTIDLTEQLLPRVAKNGHVINISSFAGSLQQTGDGLTVGHYPSYRISKTALNMYTKVLALRLKEIGTTVSAVHPGWVKTDMGGQEADITPEVAAESLYTFILSKPVTGGFWFNGVSLPW